MHQPTDTPRRERLAVALAELAALAHRGMVDQPRDGWTRVYILAADISQRERIVAALDYVEHYQRPSTSSPDTLNIWRGRLAGWPLILNQFTEPAAAAELPAEPAASWPLIVPVAPAAPPAPRRPWNERHQPSWAAQGAARLAGHAPGLTPLTDPALHAGGAA